MNDIWEAETSDPHEQWAKIQGFPGYSVSDKGRIRNDESGRLLVLTENQQGVVKVGLVNPDRKQETRSVALLVAQHHLEKPPAASIDIFDTPINLDGDRHNNQVTNLMWRPRWFAIKYHKQFDEGSRVGYKTPIQVLSTGDIYPNSMAAAIRYGILAEDTVKSVIHNTYVFPTFQKFKEFVK